LIYQIKVNSIRPTFTMTLGGTPTAVASIRANVD